MDSGGSRSILLDIPPKRRYAPDDVFFYEGNLERELRSKLGICAEDTEEWGLFEEEKKSGGHVSEFSCNIDGCRASFCTTAEFERHYAQAHENVCISCGVSYATNRLLDFHIRESHDAFFRVRAKRVPSYQCLVESCGEFFKSNRLRRRHLLDVHEFPESFRFHNQKKRRRKKRRGRGSTVKTGPPPDKMKEVDSEDGDGATNNADTDGGKARKDISDRMVEGALGGGGDEVGALEKKFRDLRVPGSLCFGQRRQPRRGHSRRW